MAGELKEARECLNYWQQHGHSYTVPLRQPVVRTVLELVERAKVYIADENMGDGISDGEFEEQWLADFSSASQAEK